MQCEWPIRPTGKYKTIAIILPNWVGDAVMATPAIRSIRYSYPYAYIIGIGQPHIVYDLYSGTSWFDEIITYSKTFIGKNGLFSTINKLTYHKIDIAILFPNSLRAAIIAYLSNSKHIIGFVRYYRSMYLHQKLYHYRYNSHLVPLPIILDYNRLAIAAGAADPGIQMQLFTQKKYEEKVDNFWRQKKLHSYKYTIMFHPAAAFGQAKMWPVSHFALLARRIVQNIDAAVIILHGPNELHIACSIVEASRSNHIYYMNELSPPSLNLTKALLRRASVLVTTDSGPRHIAAALGRPVVALFGPTHISWTDTFYDKEIKLQVKYECGPCQRRECVNYHHRCMHDLKPDQVFDAILKLLK
ncbi:MAG: lipopolysaccharide heptosyltransferase II [Thermogemmata sp.]|nr:lipopolysaccharide heptosyltransferase II [Thermogemmata sp.]